MLRHNRYFGNLEHRLARRGVQVETHLVGGQFLNTRQHFRHALVVQRSVAHHQFKGCDHVVGVKGFAVGPFHTVTQGDLDAAQVVRILEIGCQTEHRLTTVHRVEDDQRLIHQVQNRRQRGGLVEGVVVFHPCGDLFRQRGYNRFLGEGGGCHQAGRGHQPGKYSLLHGFLPVEAASCDH